MSRSKFGLALVAAVFAMGVAGAARADDAKCQDGVAKGSRNVGNQEQKKNRKCVKDGSGDVDACVDAVSPKATTKATKLADLYATGGKCDPLPAFGVGANPAAIAAETEKSSGDILRKVFGDPVDGINAGSKCQDKIAKRAGKKFDTELKAFRACIKNGVANAAAVTACVSTGVNDAKAQSTVQPKLAGDMDAQCDFSGGTAAEGMDDGSCASCTDAATCATCVGDIVDCESCEAMVSSSGDTTADCDLIDDGVANASCSSPAPPPVCPLTSGIYTTTQLTGGTLDVYSFAPFPFPSGGTIVQHVGAGNVNCVHNTVVPFPGGFSSPNFCVPALMFTTSVTQTGCGAGRIDSNGGSDFTTNEVADTSDSGCGLTAAMCVNGNNKGIRADVTVGNAAADTCGTGGTANALVTVPVHTVSWQDTSGGMFGLCPGDGVFNGTDNVAAEFDQILDFTTDTASGSWSDLDGDGCTINGFGPQAGYTKSGVCIDLGANTITAVAVGEFGATGGLFDGTFATVLPSSFTGPSGAASATCASPPAINFAGGTVTRCVP